MSAETALAAPEEVLVLRRRLERERTARRHAEEIGERATRELYRAVNETIRRLEAANEELEAFNYSVSHDLRAPLRAINGFSQALLEDYEARFDEQGRDYLHRIRAATDRMGTLIDDLLKLSRLGREEVEMRLVDLSALAASVAEELAQAEPRRQVAVEIQPGLEAHGDPELLRIALANLLRNAWKFTTRTQRPVVRVGATGQGPERAFFVADNGVGFEPRHAHRLFSPFQRLHDAREFPGNGIGLATVRRILSRHGGRIWARGSPGQGATFTFTIPTAEAQP